MNFEQMFVGGIMIVEHRGRSHFGWQHMNRNLERFCVFFSQVPREPFVFAVRALGGTCSWDATCAPGATYGESDETITHQLTDRPLVGGAAKYASR